MEVYGFAMLDIGYDFGHIGDPNWQDVLRPTKLPAFTDEFGKGGRTFADVKQTRFGVKTDTPTEYGDIKTVFEFELFGVGVDAGQTTFRLRHAYGAWKGLRAGQTWSPFMDPDVFPDSIEYWGPPGMAFFRNVQLAYSFYESKSSDVTVALERPGASADSSSIDERFDLSGVVPRFPAPDISADVKLGTSWGYVRIAGVFRYMRWDDLNPTSPTIQGHVYGGGVNVSSNIKLAPALIKLQALYGTAIENYMNDATFDVAPKADPLTTGTPIRRRRPADRRPGGIRRYEVERLPDQHRRLLARLDRQLRGTDAGRVSLRSVRARKPARPPDRVTDARAGVPVRAAYEQQRWLQRERLQSTVFGQVQFLSYAPLTG